MTELVDAPTGSTTAGPLTEQQLRFYTTFGFLGLPGMFAAEIDELTAGFEAAFAADAAAGHVVQNRTPLHDHERREIVMMVVDKDPRLSELKTDPRVMGIARQILGDDCEYAGSDGSLFYCESSWHADTYGAPMQRRHLKLSFYLDPLTADSGAIRVMPGTNHHKGTYARGLRRDLPDPTAIEAIFGCRGSQIPSWPLESRPGDLILWDYRTIHASYGGGDRRRLFSISFREAESEPDAT